MKTVLLLLLFLPCNILAAPPTATSPNQPYGIVTLSPEGEMPYQLTRRIESNVTTTSSTTWTNVTNSSFSVPANEIWSFEITLRNGCNNTGGLMYTIMAPPNAILMATSNGSTNATGTRFDVINASSATTAALCVVTSTMGVTYIRGYVQTGNQAGVLQLKFKSVVNGQTSTVYLGSYLIARKMWL